MKTGTGIPTSNLGFAIILFMVLIVPNAMSHSSDALARNLFPPFNSTDICKGVYCANGTCVPLNYPPYAKCECYDGWKQPDVPVAIPYLACVIPNCTIDYNCDEGSGPAPPPLPSHSDHDNLSDPCEFGGVCGGGRCVRNNSDLTYQCKCYRGYGNIMSWPAGFCLRQCEIQRDCVRHGISISEDSTVSGSVPAGAVNAAQGGLNYFMSVAILPVLGTFFIL